MPTFASARGITADWRDVADLCFYFFDGETLKDKIKLKGTKCRAEFVALDVAAIEKLIDQNNSI